MATQLKDGRWQARKRLRDGTRLAGYGKGPEEAHADLNAKLAEMSTLSMPQPGTLHSVAKDYWFPRIGFTKHTSQKKYIGAYIKWVRPNLGNMPVTEIRSSHCQALIGKVAEDHSASLASFVRGMVVQIMDCAVQMGIVSANHARFARAPKKLPKRHRVLGTEEAMAVLEKFEGTDLSAPVFLALILGLRRGEICGLKWEDLDRQRGELRIVRQLQPVKGKGVIEESLKSESSRRVMMLTPKLIEQIDKRGNLDSDFVCTHRGENWIPNTLGRIWSENVPENMKGWTFHDLRHGAAGLLYALGCNLFEIAAVLGHKHPGMAVLYTSVTDERMARALDGMSGLFSREAST